MQLDRWTASKVEKVLADLKSCQKWLNLIANMHKISKWSNKAQTSPPLFETRSHQVVCVPEAKSLHYYHSVDMRSAPPPDSHHCSCNQLLSTPTCCSSLSSLATSPSRRPISIFRSCFSSASCCMWCLEHVGYVSQISLCLITREFHLHRPLV